MKINWLFICLFLGGLGKSTWAQDPNKNIPEWSKHAIWYQIFPERFRDGDAKNQPIRNSIEFHDLAPESWRPSRWTGDWYAMDEWEKSTKGFYDPAVFMRRYGGDFQGILEGLPYLDSLGVNAIYFNPIFFARSMHKYDASSFHHIEPYFGPDPAGDLALMETETADPKTWKWTSADRLFLTFLKEARKRKIRVIIDGVFNHSGRDFFAFQDLWKNQARSRYKDWYIVKQFDDPMTSNNEFKYEGWWGVDTLPVFADTPDGKDLHPEVKAYVFDITRRWMDPNGDGNPEDGVDGWRLDVTNEVPVGFWADWNRLVRQINPDAYTVTELWGDAKSFIEEGGFSASMNYEGFSKPVHEFLGDFRISAAEFGRKLSQNILNYRSQVPYAMQNLTDSHDTDRMPSMLMNPDKDEYDRNNSPRYNPTYRIEKPTPKARQIQRMVEVLRYTMLGAPMLYYGTEAGMWGGDDPDDRKPMVWPDLTFEDEKGDPRGKPRTPDRIAFDENIFRFYQQVIALRKNNSIFSTGDFSVIHADNTNGTFAYSRRQGQAQAIVMLNRSEAPQTIKVAARGKSLRVLMVTSDGSSIHASLMDGALNATLPPLSSAVFLLPEGNLGAKKR